MGLLGAGDEPSDSRIEYLWPENVTAWRCWSAVQTQWRVGMGGATGLDYAGVRAWLELQDIERQEQREIFEGLRAAEGATLEVWTEQRRKDEQRKQAG